MATWAKRYGTGSEYSYSDPVQYLLTTTVTSSIEWSGAYVGTLLLGPRPVYKPGLCPENWSAWHTHTILQNELNVGYMQHTQKLVDLWNYEKWSWLHFKLEALAKNSKSLYLTIETADLKTIQRVLGKTRKL